MAEQTQGAQEEMLRYWVWLSQVFGAGSVKLLSYLQRLGSPLDVYEAMQEGLLRDLPPQAQKAMTQHTIGEADSIVYFCCSHGIMLLPIDSDDYPPMLRGISAPPALLTVQGNAELLHKPLSLSVVGTRHPSPYTERVTSTMISELCRNDFVIVSGFARGVDTVAHTAALDAGGSTVAVLGCGINVNYPRENQALRERILTSGHGALVSEYMPGTQPFPANFPKRNRILSGLGYATAVMEAAARSGSLVTAQCAVDQGRYLYCVPPADLFDPRYAGVIPLLRDGAIPLMHHEDILMAYYSHVPQYLMMQENGVKPSERLVFQDDAPTAKPYNAASLIQPTGSQQEEIRRAAAAYLAEKQADQPDEPEKPAAPAAADDRPLPEDEMQRAIVQFLRENGDTYADDIASALDLDLSALLSALTELELDGYAESLFGKQYRAV